MNSSTTSIQQRVIRVFVSSTFRDMQAEREELVKVVFPELRRLCRQREVEFVEVDLRWGVTEEQSQRGETLAICLAEIERCRPYFIGLLGERYGWVPGSLEPNALERNPWLAELREQSITELEILHGVLNNPIMAGRASFYFRDPHYLDQIPEQERINYHSESEIAAGKLAALKQRIRQSGLTLVENYPNPKSGAYQIGAELRKAIEIEFPADETRDRQAEEAYGHEVYAQSRANVYIGREADLAYLDAFVTGVQFESGKTSQSKAPANIPSPSQPPISNKSSGIFASLKKRFTLPSTLYNIQKNSFPGSIGQGGNLLIVSGPSGCGKSALLANWALRYRLSHPDEYIFLHFIGSTPGSADYITLLRRLLQELKIRFGIPHELPGTPEELRETLPVWLAIAVNRSPNLTLVLDGLNQLEDHDQAPDLVWLPESFPDNIRVLASTLPGRSLDALHRRRHTEFEVQLLTEAERLQLIEEYLGRYRKHLEERRAQRIATVEATANPLYLRVVLEELRQFGIYEELDEQIEHYLQTPTIGDLYIKVLERLESDYEDERKDLVQEALSLVWVARRGLSESELLELMGDVPHSMWSPLYLALEEAFVLRDGVINFFHDFLRQAVGDRYLPDEEKQKLVRLHLVDYFERRWMDGRKVDELPWLLAKTGEWQRLQNQLADLDFFAAAWKRNPYEVKTYWTQVEANSSFNKLDAYQAVLKSPQEYQEIVLWDLAILLADTGCPDEALSLWTHLAERSRQAGDINKLAAALGNQAAILSNRGDLDRAFTLHQEEERIWRQSDNLDGLARSLGNQAVILTIRGDLSAALSLLKEEERICRKLGNFSGISSSLGNQANIYTDLGELSEALELLQEQENVCRQLGDLDGLQIALGNLANILYSQGDLDRAIALHKEEERICRQLGNLDGVSKSLSNQSNILNARGYPDEALALLKEAENYSRRLGNLDGLAVALGNQGKILYNQGKLDEALDLHREAERLYNKIGDPNGVQVALSYQGLILYDRGDLDGAMAFHKKQEDICRKQGIQDGLQISLGNQGLVLSMSGDLNGALALHQEKEQICRQLNNQIGIAISLSNQAIILNALGNKSQALLLANQALGIAREYGYESMAQQFEGTIRQLRR